MAVCHCEEVRPPILAQMRQYQEAVLVDLVRILRAESCFGGEGEFCNAVIELFVGLSGLHSVLSSS